MEITEVKLSFYLDVLRRHWKAILVSVLIASALGLVYCMLAQKTYVSTGSLMPEEGDQSLTNPLGMISANLGFAAPSKGKNSDLYEDVVKSRTFIKNLLPEKFRTVRGDSVGLETFYELTDLPAAKRVEVLSGKFKSALKVEIAPNGLIGLSLETPDPIFSSELLTTLLRKLEIFFKDQETKKTEKSLEFIKEKVEEKEVQYRRSSEAVAAFLAQNQYVDPIKTPFLFNKLDGLKEDERIQQEIYLLLYKEYEKARIDKQKEKSTMRILDYPEPALDKEKPQRRKIMMGMAGGAFVLAYLMFLMSDRFRAKA
jgi:uncharacterized protein involved in exopolysaccharide biosynthesis